MSDETAQSPFGVVAVVGAGLIGSSVVRAFERFGGAEEIRVYDAAPSVRDVARQISLGDVVCDSVQSAIEGASLVVVAVPVGAVGAVFSAIAPHLSASAVVTDVGSVKASVIAQARAHLPTTTSFVPGHPIAGTEESGPDAGFAELFDGYWCILTPEAADVGSAGVALVSAMWQRFGSNVDVMDADHHDRVLAITSHVPHLIAYNIVGTASDMEQVTQQEVVKYSAGGFRDFTRIAASDPVMWRDVFLNNKDAVLEMLGRFSEDLSALQRAIRWDKADELEALFTRTRDIRRGIVEAGLETTAPDFGRRSAAAGVDGDVGHDGKDSEPRSDLKSGSAPLAHAADRVPDRRDR